MKRVGRLIGFIGGAAAVLWAMRDRLVSIAAPAEPQPPKFRVVTPPAPVPAMPSTETVTDDLTQINGIGPVFASRLRAAGLDSFEKIAASDDATLAEAVGVPEARVEGWRRQAEER